MRIHFDWKYSKDQLPNEGDAIVILHNNKLIRGHFRNKASWKEYDYCVQGAPIEFNKLITIGRGLGALLKKEDGFYWDYLSLDFNKPEN